MYQRNEAGFGFGSGAGGGAAVLTLDKSLPQILRVNHDAKAAAWPADGWRAREPRVTLAVDLGARIGGREWWRGLATLGALLASVALVHPRLTPLVADTDAPLAQAHWDEARALAISPLAYGADTGRGMAATDAVEPLADTPERPTIDLVQTIGQGDGLARALERAGVADGEAQGVAAMVGREVDTSSILPGTRMEVTLGRRPSKAVPRPLDHLGFRARFDLKLALDRVGGALAMKRIPIAVDETPLRIQGRVGSGLYLAARAAGAPGQAVELFLRQIAQHLSIERIGPDATFDLILAHRRAETGETETGDLLYAGLAQNGKATRLLKWTTGGATQWYEASGVGEKRGMMARPVEGHETSGFGMRFHPILGYSRMHQGVDFGAPYGSPIVAATDGAIEYAGWHGGHGNYVKIAHGNGIETGYGHMSRIAVRYGEHVRQGQVIGYVGSTGLSTGPHLHYEVYQRGVAINPLSFKFTSTAQLAGAELERFKATLAHLLSVKPGAANAPFGKVVKVAGLRLSRSRPDAG